MPAPSRAHVLDKLIGAELPRFDSMADVLAFEAQAPYAERVAAQSTYEALQLGAALNPGAPAIHFLPNASPDEPPLTLTHAQFLSRVTQAANLFHALGVGAGDVVSLLLPLLPQAFVTLFGAQAVGVANPVNPMLSAAQIADILRAAGTRVLVTLGPSEGSDIWDKVTAIRQQLPTLKSVLLVGARALPDLAADDFDAWLDPQPATHLLTGRMPLRGRHRRLLPHRRHHRHAEAGAPHARQPGVAGVGPSSAGLGSTRPRPAVRAAAVPRGRRADAGPGAVGQWRPRGRARRRRLARPTRTAQRVGAGAALPAAVVRRRAHGVGGGAASAGGRARCQQPEARLRRRLGDSGGGDPGLRGAVASAGARGLRHDRNLQRAHHGLPRHAAPSRLGGPPAALRSHARGQARRRRPSARRLRSPTRSAWWRWRALASSAAT